MLLLNDLLRLRYPSHRTAGAGFDENAAVLACAPPAVVRCSFGQLKEAKSTERGTRSSKRLIVPTKYSCVMHQETGLPAVYVTSLSTTIDIDALGNNPAIPLKRDGDATHSVSDETCVVALCLISNFCRFSFFEGVLQELYQIAVDDFETAQSPSVHRDSVTFVDMLDDSQVLRCAASVVDSLEEFEFGAVQRLQIIRDSANVDDDNNNDNDRNPGITGLIQIPTHSLGIPIFAPNEKDTTLDGDDPSSSHLTPVRLNLQWHTLLASPALPEVDAQCFFALFSCLSVSSVLKIIGLLLTDAKVLLVSRSISLLTPVAEALSALLYP